MITARSITYCNSRMLPGHSYLQEGERLVVDAVMAFAGTSAQSMREVLREQGNVLAAVDSVTVTRERATARR